MVNHFPLTWTEFLCWMFYFLVLIFPLSEMNLSSLGLSRIFIKHCFRYRIRKLRKFHLGCSWGREESVDVAAPLKFSDCPSVSLLPPRRFLRWPQEHLAMRAAHVQSRPHAQKKSSSQEQLLVTWLRKEECSGWKLRIPRQSTNALLSVSRDKRW